MRGKQITKAEKINFSMDRKSLISDMRVLYSSSLQSFEEVFQDELDKRKSIKEKEKDSSEKNYQSLLNEFIELLLSYPGQSLMKLTEFGLSESLFVIINNLRKETEKNHFFPNSGNATIEPGLLESKKTQYHSNQIKYRDPAGAQYTASI